MSWEYVTLDKMGAVSRGRSKHRPRNDPSLFGGAYPFIQTADVKAAPFYITQYSDTYNEKGLEQSKLWYQGTLCITIAANIADTAILGIDACFPDSIMGFIPYEGISDVRFVKYAFDMLQINVKQISQGTAQDNLSWQKLSTIKFPNPPYEIQKKIADYLVSYEDLIENNQKQIKLLEEAAQRLYKEWFVDLRFPGYEDVQIVDGVPEGWKKRTLGEVLKVIRGRSYSSKELSDRQGVLMVNLSNIRPYGGYNRNQEKRYTGKYTKEQLVKTHDLLMGVTDMTQERRTVGRVAIVPKIYEEAMISMDLIKLEPFNGSSLFYYSLLCYGGYSEAVSRFANGTNVLHLRPDVLNIIDVILPTEKLQQRFTSYFENLQDRIDDLQDQILLATEARNRLLPKLMSGEIKL